MTKVRIFKSKVALSQLFLYFKNCRIPQFMQNSRAAFFILYFFYQILLLSSDWTDGVNYVGFFFPQEILSVH